MSLQSLDVEYTDFDTYADLATAEAGSPWGGHTRGIRAIRCDASGVLMVTTSSGTAKALHFAAGETCPVRALAIVAAGSSGCAPITVFR